MKPSAILLLLPALVLLTTPAAAAAEDTVAEIIIHGNYRTADETIHELLGLEQGDAVTEQALSSARERLESSGLFASVELRVRYASISAEGPVILVVYVVERERISDKLFYLPILELSDEYGLTYGMRTTIKGLLGGEERISVPASWGGRRQIGLELILPRPIPGLLDRLELRAMRWQEENPAFEIRDTRNEYALHAARRIDWLVVDGGLGLQNVAFAEIDTDAAWYSAGAALDTRASVSAPQNALYAGIGWRRWDIEDTEAVDTYRYDLRGYLRLFGRTVLAGQAALDVSSDPLPPWLQPFAGGYATLRGYEAGRFVGDNRALASLELRTTLSPATAFFRAGVHLFADMAAVYPDGESLGDQEYEKGIGIGGFFFAGGLGIVLDVAWDLDNDVRLHVGPGFRF